MKKNIFIFLILSLLPGQINAQSSNLMDELEALHDSLSGDGKFDTFIVNTKKYYESFRDSINKNYADFLEKTWSNASFHGIEKRQKDKEVKPTIEEPDDNKNRKDRVIKGEIVPIMEDRRPQPQPVAPIEENKMTKDFHEFVFYGTTMKVRWGGASVFKFSAINNKEVAKAYRMFSAEEYKNLLHDCLDLRKKHDLCDWAYYKMLEKMAETACGKGTNEAVFLHGMVYAQSGYMMRFAIDPEAKRLHLLCGIVERVYNYSCYRADGSLLYLLDKSTPKKLEFCSKEYPGEQVMSLEINNLPKLAKNLSEEKIIHARSYPITIRSKINKNLIQFFDEYPTSYTDNNFMTRWAFYANTPASDELRNDIYPQLREKLTNAPPLLAVDMLLNWIQPTYGSDAQQGQKGFPYGYDNEIWGYDRAFFADETLFYPMSDCEDHAILFSRLVRDLIGLDVVLVYYPEHLAAAVCFDTDVKGDAVMVNGRKFMITDPTLSRGKIGVTMSQYVDIDQKEIKVILLKK